MKITQHNNVSRVNSANGFSSEMRVRPGQIEIIVKFSDGTIISKYGKTNYWICQITKDDFTREEVIASEDLLIQLPKAAAEEMIYNIDIFINL